MITKDIVYNLQQSNEQKIKNNEQEYEQTAKEYVEMKINTEEPLNEIDSIFNEADILMKQKQAELNRQAKQKKTKRKMKWWKKLLICFLVVLSLLIAGAIGSICYIKNVVYPPIKEAVIEQYLDLREKVSEMDDSTLSPEQIYQKKLILMFSPEDLGEMIENLNDISNLEALLNLNSGADLSFLPENKIEEFERIYNEYLELKENQDETIASADTNLESHSVNNNK